MFAVLEKARDRGEAATLIADETPPATSIAPEAVTYVQDGIFDHVCNDELANAMRPQPTHRGSCATAW